jgi:hypothetical protein
MKRVAVAELRMAVVLAALLVLGVAAPVAAWSGGVLNDSQEPGSVLVFPYFRTGTVPSNQSPTHPKTEIEISVTCPRDTTCTTGDANTGEAVRLRAHWVCPGAGLQSKCDEVNFNLSTTVNGTLFFNPDNAPELSTPSNTGLRNATVPPPPCARGFLIVWVIDQLGRPIKYDGLIGNAVVREGLRSAVAYNALPIQAGPDLATRAPTDENPGPGGYNGKLDFDGIEYTAITGKVFGTVRYEDAPAPLPSNQTRLILLTLDVVSNLPNKTTFVDLDFFKTDETVVSDSVDFVCWTRVRLTDINPSFIISNMGRKGLVESTRVVQGTLLTGFQPVTLVGLVETDERLTSDAIDRDWMYYLSNDSTPVTTTFTPSE